jgi:hypothetical protein
MIKWVTLLGLLACTTLQAANNSGNPLTTVAERSKFERTGRYTEVEQLCTAFAERFVNRVRCFQFGTTPEGRRMLALAVSDAGVLTSDEAKRRSNPVVFMQGGIHAGEIDGKDAGFLALRQMLEGEAAPGALEKVTLVFVPVLNVDGHERFGEWNRPNQSGPEEMGWRTTAQNLNLNRDYTKADAPEMQALLRLLNEWDPILYVDLHATDGADFEHDIAYVVSPTLAGDEDLRRAGVALQDDLIRRMTELGSLPLDFYPSLQREDDPQSGFSVAVGLARFSQEYWAKRNRIGVLVETHSWKPYPKRVQATRHSIVTMMELAAQHAKEWMQLSRQAKERNLKLGGQTVPLVYENTPHERMIEFKGYAYSREPSAISGALVTKYDPSRPQIWRIPLKDQVQASVSVTAPRGGYIVPAAHAAWMREKLSLHNIQFETLARLLSSEEVDVYRADKADPTATTYEGRTMLSLEGKWRKERRDIPSGSLFVPIAQPNSSLAIALFEPGYPDSFVRWGFFNAAFEPKEYMEAYVVEEIGTKMLKDDPAVRAEFSRKLAEDPEFARSPAKRLEFFYRRHSSWDDQLNLYPVFRTDRELK